MLLLSQELHIDLLLLSSEEIHAIFPHFYLQQGNEDKNFGTFTPC
jgi:hypothetical protein